MTSIKLEGLGQMTTIQHLSMSSANLEGLRRVTAVQHLSVASIIQKGFNQIIAARNAGLSLATLEELGRFNQFKRACRRNNFCF
jgi:hypothetical protein